MQSFLSYRCHDAKCLLKINHMLRLTGLEIQLQISQSYSYHHTESSQNIQRHGYNVVNPNQHGYQHPQYQPVTSKNTLGRCFQETAAGQVYCQRQNYHL